MVSKPFAIAIFACLPGYGLTVTANSNSPTQATLSYNPPTSAACTVEVSESATYSPLVHDVDTTLFAGSDQDNRTGALTNSTSRVFVVGTRLTELALDGKKYSRALQQGTQHYYRVTCAGPTVATGVFTTKVLPYGSTYQDIAPTNTDGTFNYPDTFDVRNSTINDSQTGILAKRVSISTDSAGGLLPPWPSAGGFGSFASDVLSAQGNHHVAVPGFSSDNLYLYAMNPTTGDSIFAGLANGSYNSMDARANGFFGMGTAELVSWGNASSTVIYQAISIFGKSTIARWTYTGADAPVAGGTLAAGTTVDMLGGSDLTDLARAFDSSIGAFDLVGTATTAASASPCASTAAAIDVTWVSGSKFVLGSSWVGRLINVNGVYTIIESVVSDTVIKSCVYSGLSPVIEATPVAFRINYFNCVGVGSQANYELVQCRAGQQDSMAWEGAFSFGNGVPLGGGGSTAGFVALTSLYGNAQSRWSGDHTYEFLGQSVPIYSFANSNMHGTGVGHGPYAVVLGTALSARTPGTVDTNVAISSSSLVGGHDTGCTDTWSAPAGWVDGEPLSPCYAHYVQTAEVGDVLLLNPGTGTQEFVQITVKHSSTLWDIRRGVQSFGGMTPAHFSGEQGWMYNIGQGEAYNTDQAFGWGYVFWDFVNSPHGTEHAGDYILNWGNHPVTRGTHRTIYDFCDNCAPTNKSQWGVPPPNIAPTDSVFAGVTAAGSVYQKHPSMASGNDAFMADRWYWVGGNVLCAQDSSCASLVSPFSHVYRYDPTTGIGNTMNEKVLPIISKTRDQTLKDISGPGVMITDSDDYAWCKPRANGECVSGSLAADPYIYFSLSTLTVPWCTGGENPTVDIDICFGSFNAQGLAANQTKYVTPDDTTGHLSMRPLSRSWENFLSVGSTDGISNNIKFTYDGAWGLIIRALAPNSQVWALKIPPDPGSDGIDRGTFVPAVLNLTAPTGMGIAKAQVKFWYCEYGGTSTDPYCTSRREACVATRAAITDLANPFWYLTTDASSVSSTRQSCSTTCTITLPVYPLHTAYFTVEYLDSGNTLVTSRSGVAIESTIVNLGAAPVAGGNQRTGSFSGVSH